MAIFDCIIQLYTLYNCVIGCTNKLSQMARIHCCLNVGPLSSTLSQRWNSVLASLHVYCHLDWCSQARRCRLIAGALRLALCLSLGGVAREARVSSWSGVPNRWTQAHIWQCVVGSTPYTQVAHNGHMKLSKTRYCSAWILTLYLCIFHTGHSFNPRNVHCWHYIELALISLTATLVATCICCSNKVAWTCQVLK